MAFRFALAGNPNSGKTTLFNELTGSNAHVGNWPGVTVDRREGTYKKHGMNIDVIDLPGIYSLSPYTPEEVVARNFLIDEKPDLIINIIDATNLERNLYLTTQLMEIDCPIVIALNMMDLVERDNDKIDVPALEKALGIPVFPISALRNKGVRELMEAANTHAKSQRAGHTVLAGTGLSAAFKQALHIVEQKGLANRVFHAVKLMENDPLAIERAGLTENSPELKALEQTILSASDIGDSEAAVADMRYRYITKELVAHIKRAREVGELTRSDKVDKILTNRFLGIPIFLLFMFLAFHFTFSENLFFVTGIPSPGKWLEGLAGAGVEWIAEQASLLLEAAGASAWAHGLVVDGILGGVGAVLGFLPLVMILFLFLSIMEESGYMARAAFIMDRLLRRFGLSGKAFVPMLMGFGCSVPAIMGVRTLESDRDRKVTMMLIPFMSCGAKYPIYAIFAGALFTQHADLMTFGIYLIGILVAVIAGIILKNTVFKEEAAPFIMEMPAYHRPRLKNLLLHLWDKAKGYIVRAGTIILASTVVIWLLANFNFRLQMVEANSAESILGVLGNILRVFFIPLGFAGGENGWKAVVAILTGLLAKEAVVSTMGVLYNPGIVGDALEDQGAMAALTATIAASFSPVAALSFMAFNLLSVPCMAAVGALRSEIGSKKWFWFTIAFWIVIAWVVSFLIFWGGTGLNLLFKWY